MEEPWLPRRPRSVLGRNIQRLRWWWNWTEAVLAHHAGVSPSLIERIEQDRANPRLSELRQLARALRVLPLMLLDPLTELITVDEDRRQRFWAKVSKGGLDECWHWRGLKNPKGYGKARLGDTVTYAHRIAYGMTAPLPAHWTVDHTCGQTSCVNPKHLAAVPAGWNLYERDRRRSTKKLRELLAAWSE